MRYAGRFAPCGPWHPTAGLGFVIPVPTAGNFAWRSTGPPRFPENPPVPMPCSSTPAGPRAPGTCGLSTWPPLRQRRRLPTTVVLSGLNSTASGLAVYASSGRFLRTATQDSLPVVCQTLPGGIRTRRILRKVSESNRYIRPPLLSFPGAISGTNSVKGREAAQPPSHCHAVQGAPPLNISQNKHALTPNIGNRAAFTRYDNHCIETR